MAAKAKAKTAASPFLPFMQQHMGLLNTSLKDLTVDALKALFGHVYYIWRTFKPALGEKDGLKYYGNVWGALADMSFDGAMQKFGLKEVKDLPTLGRIVEDCFIGVPALYITRRNTATEHVGHVQWCANPAYGPADCTYCRHDYYRQEVYLTYVYIWELIEKAKKAGLKEEVLVDLPSGRCRDGSACACQIILRTRDANPDLPLPEVERKFVDLEMGGQEPVLYILKKQKRTLEEQGPGSFLGFFAVDYLAWVQLNAYVKPRATQIYLKLWQSFPKQWVRDAKVDCEVGKVKTAQDVAAIIACCQKKKFIGMKAAAGRDGSVVLTAEADPFVQVGDMLQADKGYRAALAAMDEDFVKNILKELKVEKKAAVKFTAHIARGDSKTQLVVSMK